MVLILSDLLVEVASPSLVKKFAVPCVPLGILSARFGQCPHMLPFFASTACSISMLAFLASALSKKFPFYISTLWIITLYSDSLLLSNMLNLSDNELALLVVKILNFATIQLMCFTFPFYRILTSQLEVCKIPLFISGPIITLATIAPCLLVLSTQLFYLSFFISALMTAIAGSFMGIIYFKIAVGELSNSPKKFEKTRISCSWKLDANF